MSPTRVDWQCEYAFVQGYTEDGGYGYRRCYRGGTYEHHGRWVCSAHLDYIVSILHECDMCHRWRTHHYMRLYINRSPRPTLCEECVDRYWPRGTREFQLCMYCASPISDRRYPFCCYRRHCKLIGEFWRGFNHRSMHPRLSRRWDGMGKLKPLCEVVDFLRRMAHPKTAREREFAKRYAHMRQGLSNVGLDGRSA